MSNKAIFTPIKVGNSLLQHRVVLAPLTRRRASTEAAPTDLLVEYYKQRASEGGLLITEATLIDRLAGGFPKVPGIYRQEQIEGWKKVTSAVHEKNGTIFLQLWHNGRAASKLFNPNQEQIVSASAIAITGTPVLGGEYEVPRALEVDEIKTIVEQYKRAALYAIEAGFDGVEIHGANGYLLDQFINSGSNKRTDNYGGSIENRSRFTLEVVDAVVEAVGAERVAIRFSPGGSFQDMQDDTVVETWTYLTTEIQKRHANLAYLHFIEARSNFFVDTDVPAPDSLEIYRKIWKGPFVTAGGFSNTTQHAINLAEKTGDLIAFGRAFIANPDLPARLANDWELNNYDRSSFYGGDAHGYTDYPFYDETKS
ncbi:hypothetical protein INT47_011915 [Mucor saturninus]|uniref:NADH:flavin oxidoreductase/NADH oxidase N-terminal domain-containing protein n=1 Tax=Mucor saturninus TaxID=64648 RepID=A0A8H7UWA6_9FUNG|nr:hypothetical protein INT47_011915 [Mucor saturninus]